MRVATYTQPIPATRGSVAALSILVLTILLGTTVASTLATYFMPTLAGVVTYVWMGAYLLALLGLLFGHGINWISWLIRYRILLVLLLTGAVVSVSWSVDARVSAERVVHLVGTSLIGIYLGYTVPLLRMLRVFASVLAVIMVSSLVAALVLPELGFSAYQGTLVWSGILNSKNDLGFWAATGVLLYVTLSDSTHSIFLRLLCYALAGLCLALLAFSQSATSLLAMLVAGSLSLYLFIAARFRLGFIQMGVVALLFTALIGFAVLNIDTAELVGRTDDLTGRGEVWRQTWKLIMDRPLTGYGYGSIWFPTEATLWIQQSLTDFTWIVYHAHNGFLQVASEIGMPMAIIALLMVAQQMIEIFYCQYERQQVGVLFVLAYVVLFLIGNFSEARFLVTRELYWIFFIALPVSMLRQINVVADVESGPTPADDDADDDLARSADAGMYGQGFPGSHPDMPPRVGSALNPSRGLVTTGASDRFGGKGAAAGTMGGLAAGMATDSSSSISDHPWDGDAFDRDLIGERTDLDNTDTDNIKNTASTTNTDSTDIDLGVPDASVSGERQDDVRTSTDATDATDAPGAMDETSARAQRPAHGYGGDATTDDAVYDDAIREDWYELPTDVTHDETLAARAAAADRFDKIFDETGDGTDDEWFDLSLEHGNDRDR